MEDPDYEAIQDFMIFNSIREVLSETKMTLQEWFFDQIVKNNHVGVIQLIEKGNISPEIKATNGYSALQIAELYSNECYNYLKNTIEVNKTRR